MRKKWPARAPEETRAASLWRRRPETLQQRRLFRHRFQPHRARSGLRARHLLCAFRRQARDFPRSLSRLESVRNGRRLPPPSRRKKVRRFSEKDITTASQVFASRRPCLRHHREWHMFRKSLRALTVTDERVHQSACRSAHLARSRKHPRLLPRARHYANAGAHLCQSVVVRNSLRCGRRRRCRSARPQGARHSRPPCGRRRRAVRTWARETKPNGPRQIARQQAVRQCERCNDSFGLESRPGAARSVSPAPGIACAARPSLLLQRAAAARGQILAPARLM